MEKDDLKAKIEKIKILVMDVDGTLTDGTVFYSARGEEMKRFSLRDGMGIELLRKADIESAILTSETSAIVEQRAKKLKIKHVLLGSRNKKKDLENLAKKLSLSLEEIAYIGDDVNDIFAMQISGVSACPADAAKEVKRVVDHCCKANAGYGAVREFCELILVNQNRSIVLTENW
jgi:3-deoxy-D-manno-octulosonate 8-phosphate phosphatase (KDO 8-P phosphatase)